MGTLFSALDISTSGLQVSQVQLDVTSHNIANVNTEGFSRQRVELTTRFPITREFGQIPQGVAVGRIGRLRDALLDGAFRRQVGGLGESDLIARYFSQVEATFIEPTENSFSTRIGQFFQAFNDFANNVELLPSRQAAISEAEAIATTFQDAAGRINRIRTNVNNEVENIATQINGIAEQIANLNDRIRPLEVGTREASDLRDERDNLLDELSRLVDTHFVETPSGEINVVIANEQLIYGNRFNAVEAVANPALDPERPDLFEIQFVNSGRLLTPNSGQLAAAFEMRDTILTDIDANLDELASTFMLEMNRIHTAGRGLEAYSGAFTSANAVTDPSLALNAAGLGFTVTPGSFDVVVYDAANNAVTTNIAVGAATSLNDLATALNGVANISASVTNGQLTVTPAAGFSTRFANDTSDALSAIGLNVLFTGSDARDIGVNQDIVANPNLLSSGFDSDITATGDNSAALAMADVQHALIYNSGASNINEFFESSLTEIAIDARANLNRLEVETEFVEDFDRRRQEVSGVNLDEEVTNLIQFQRAFEASARALATVDRMLDTLINGTR